MDRIRNNQKRRLMARGGRRKKQDVHLIQEVPYFPINRATGEFSKVKELDENNKPTGNYVIEDTRTTMVPRVRGRSYYWDQQTEKTVTRYKHVKRLYKVRVAV